MNFTKAMHGAWASKVPYWLFQFAALLICETVFSGSTISIIRSWLEM